MNAAASQIRNPQSAIRNPSVAAVVVTWNQREDTLECVRSLLESDYPAVEVLVVDNGSVDRTGEALADRYPAARRLDSGANLGYAGGNNLGMREAFTRGADYAFVLNNDTTLEPDCITKLVEVARADPAIAVVAPAIYYHDAPDQPWFLGSTLDIDAGIALHDNSAEPSGPADLPWATGCAMLVSREAFERTGGFDERLFIYCEDVEWSIRLRRAGFRILLAPDARLYHKVSRAFGALSPRAIYYGVRNTLLVVQRHCSGAGRAARLRCIAWRHLRESLRLAKNDPRGAYKLPFYAVRGIVDFARGRTGPL